MHFRLTLCFLAASSLFSLCSAPAQSIANPLTLEQAETMALANQPRLLAAQLRARAASERMHQARSAYGPTVTFNATGTRVADTSTAIASGALPTSALSNRFAYGGTLTQLITDFGRTSALVGSANQTALAQDQIATLTRAQVRLNVREAFYSVLGAQSVLRAAQAALANRQLISRQLNALAQSELRSTLDVNFAKVLESEAELAVVRAQSLDSQARSRLATAIGSQSAVMQALVDVSQSPQPLPLTAEDLQAQALAQRADLNASMAEQRSAEDFAKAEKRLQYPTLSVLGTAGHVPFHDHTLHDDYAAAGFNLSIPVFNSGLFHARQVEAQLEAQARGRDVQQAKLQVTQEVRDAWFRTDEAYRSIDVSARLVAQSREALRLAQDRYNAGLGSIVELNEAQLNETSAEITAADANYTYLSRRAELDYAAGLLN